MGQNREKNIQHYVKYTLSAVEAKYKGRNAKNKQTMELVGKITEIGQVESGSSDKGPWQKQTVVIVTLEQNPQYVAFTAMGRRLEEVGKCTIGQVVRIRFGVSSRKFQDRWFSDLQLWEIQNV
jgi:hypothetical protein